jgi:hypothetical protein
MYHLYSGSRFLPPPKVYPPPLQHRPTPLVPFQGTNDIDISRVDGLVTYNSFSLNCVREATSGIILPSSERDLEKPSAIYTLPSIFNHSCHPNAMWRCFGDVMVIRARQTVLEGEEVTLPYTLGHTYIDREKALAPIIEMQCDCTFCAADRADGKIACRQRKTLIDEMNATKKGLHRSTMSNPGLEDHVGKLMCTYHSKQSVPRPPLFVAYFDVMQVTERDGNRQGRVDLISKSVQFGMKALEAAGFTGIDTRMKGRKALRRKLPLSKNCLAAAVVNSDVCSVIMVHMAASFLMLSEADCAERWFRAAWWGEGHFSSCLAIFLFMYLCTQFMTPPLAEERLCLRQD